MQIKKTQVSNLIASLGEVDRLSRRKGLSSEDVVKLTGDAIRAVRSALTVLRKLK